MIGNDSYDKIYKEDDLFDYVESEDDKEVPIISNNPITKKEEFHRGDFLFGDINTIYTFNAERVEPEDDSKSNISIYLTKVTKKDSCKSIFVYLGDNLVMEYYSSKIFYLLDDSLKENDDTILLICDVSKDDFMKRYNKFQKYPVGIKKSSLRKFDMNDKNVEDEFAKNATKEIEITNSITDYYDTSANIFRKDMEDIRSSYYGEAYLFNAIKNFQKKLSLVFENNE